MGCAYEGTAAELLTTRAHPAVKAVVPMFSDFDPWLNLVSPGGILNDWFIRYWRDGTHMLDNNDLDDARRHPRFADRSANCGPLTRAVTRSYYRGKPLFV
jgi:hypothetical protein